MEFIKTPSTVQFSNMRRALVLVISPFLFGFAASAQTPAATSAKPTQVVTTPASNPVVKTTDNATSSTGDYKKRLSDLAALYETEVQRLEKENNQLKELYRDGLVARMVLEASEKSLADARAKVEKVRGDIAAADKPAALITADESAVLFGASDTSWTTGNAKIDGLIRYNANKYGVDSYLIFCLMSQESGFSSKAMSNKGAQGLMQLMPGTAARYGVTNPYDVAQSIMGGTRYLKDLLQMFNGRIDLALAGYNAGEGAVMKFNYTVPPYSETRNYVRLISQRYSKKKPVALTKPA
jgi:soluble lytic murein transglycosylase-like protein